MNTTIYDAHVEDGEIIKYVSQNLNVEEVFSEKEILDRVREQYNPGDVFPARALEIWAVDNGYVKEGE